MSIPCPPIPPGTFALENSVAMILLLMMSVSPPNPPYSLGMARAINPFSISIFCHSERVTFLAALSFKVEPLNASEVVISLVSLMNETP